MSTEHPMTSLVATLRHAAKGDRLTIGEMLDHLGTTSFAAVILLPALLLVTPLSGIPTFPTIGGAVIFLVAIQWLAGRDHLWLPDFLKSRSISSARFCNALDWMDRPATFIDRHTHHRLRPLTRRPLSALTLLTITAIVVTWPLLELLPFITTLGASIVSIFAVGLMTRDGLFVLFGYGLVLALALTAIALI
jgi:hypothetical protein